MLELYALDSSLARSRADLGRTQARAAELARLRAVARSRYLVAQQTLAGAQALLARQLRLLYQQDEPDPIAVVLGATSLDDAIERLDSIRRTARATKAVVAESETARSSFEHARTALAAAIARNQAVLARLTATAAGLERARSERSAYVAELRRKEALTTREIATLDRRAEAAQARARAIAARAEAAAPTATAAARSATIEAAAETLGLSQPQTPPKPPAGNEGRQTAAAPGPPRPGETMAVYATGYCLRGTTATGLPVGPGIVAVDPTVIPLGTRMSIPGYGDAVAADVGGAIKGARIDVWIASCAEAAAFTRTVTVTFR